MIWKMDKVFSVGIAQFLLESKTNIYKCLYILGSGSGQMSSSQNDKGEYSVMYNHKLHTSLVSCIIMGLIWTKT